MRMNWRGKISIIIGRFRGETQDQLFLSSGEYFQRYVDSNIGEVMLKCK